MNTGGPAFPVSKRNIFMGNSCQGMTLLDWFAGQALMGLVQRGFLDSNGELTPYPESTEDERLASDCYTLAQAMLDEKRRLENTS